MIKRKILVVDDDQDILDLLHYNFGKAGYEVKTINVSSKVVAAAKAFAPDLIIMDIMMPGRNGIELCRDLRSDCRFNHVYIFFLTARSENYYQQAVFHIGGDDFIEKITGLRALTKKVNAVLHTDIVISKRQREIVINDLRIDRNSYKVFFQDKEVKLSIPEFELLFFLAQNIERSISLDLLVQCIWGTDSHFAMASIDMFMQNIRKKIGWNIIEKQSGACYLIHEKRI